MFEEHNVKHHLLADDKQLYVGACITELTGPCSTHAVFVHSRHAALVCSRRVHLNTDKTQLILFGTRAVVCHPQTGSVSVGSTVVQPAEVARDLGVMLDSEL